MLRIIVKHRNGHQDMIEWELNSTTRPFHPKTWCPAFGDLTVIADGPELGWIKQHFAGIPMVSAARQVRWTGDDATFIVNNVPCVSGAYGLYYEQPNNL